MTLGDEPQPGGATTGVTGILFWRRAQWWHRTALASGTFVTAQLVAFVGTVVAARGLGPERYGQVVLALALCSFVALLVDVTLEEALIHFGIEDATVRDGTGLRPLFRLALFADLAIGLVVFAGLFIAAGLVAALSGEAALDAGMIRLASVVTLAATIDGTTGAALLVVGRPDLRTIATLVTGVVRLVLIVVALTIDEGGAVLVAIGAATVAGAVTQAGLAWRFGWRRWPVQPERRRPPVSLRRLVRFAVQSSATSSLGAASAHVVPVVLGRFLGSAAVAHFNVAFAPAIAISLLTTPLRLAVLSEQTALWARGRRDQVRRSLKLFSLSLLGVYVPIMVVGWLAMPWGISWLFGDRFLAAVAPARILLFATLGLAVSGWAKLLPIAAGRPVLRTVVGAGELVVTTVLIGVLALARGLSGSAVGYTVASFAVALAWIVVIRRQLFSGAKGDAAHGVRLPVTPT